MGRWHRTCPACGVGTPPTAARTPARWCGACGEPLPADPGSEDPGSDDPDARRPTPRRIRPAVLGGATALLCLGVVAASLLGERTWSPGAQDLGVGLGPEEVADVLDTPVGEDGPVCLRDPGCVAWVEPASIAGRVPSATVAGDVTLVRVREALEARSTDDGALRWRTQLHSGSDLGMSLPVATTGDAALLTETNADGGSDLLALDLADGAARWRLPDVTELIEVRDHGEVLVALVRRPNLDEEVLALDSASGAVRWSIEGEVLRLVPDGAVVVDDGAVALVDPAGEPAWREPLSDGFVPSWIDVTGRFVRVLDGQGEEGPARSLADGTELTLPGELVSVADPSGQPDDPFGSGLAALIDRDRPGGTDVTLLDGDEVAWQVTFERLGCCAPFQLDGDAVTIPASDGGRWHLSRRDGEVLDRTDPQGDEFSASRYLPIYGDVSVEELDPTASTPSDLALVEGGETTARLPSGSWPVGATDAVVVVRSETWVAAIRRHGGPADR